MSLALNNWAQMANETTDVNIVGIKRVCEEIVLVRIQKESIDVYALRGYLIMFEDPALVI